MKKKKSPKKSKKKWPTPIRLIFLAVILATSNFTYQILRKPLEVLSFLPFTAEKTMAETWNAYAEDFKAHAYGGLTPSFLAALAQAESGGNSLASPSWVWSARHYQRLYAPASSAFGLMQLTKGTFESSLGLCRDNQVVKKGDCRPMIASRAFSSLSIDLSTRNIVYSLRQVLGRNYLQRFQKKRIWQTATVIHLCGTRKARRFARSGFRFSTLGKCGSHQPSRYWAKIHRFQKRFHQLQR